MRGAIIGGSLLIASASAGIVWLSIAAVGGIAAVLGPFWAQVIVGVVLLAPLAVVALLASPLVQERRDAPVVADSANDAAMATITAAAKRMIDKSPLAALSLAGLAGLISTSYPLALSVVATVLKETDDLGQADPAHSSAELAAPRAPSCSDADAKAVNVA